MTEILLWFLAPPALAKSFGDAFDLHVLGAELI